MRVFNRLSHRWPTVLASGAALVALALLWIVRAMPLQPAPGVRIDALSAFFIFALLGGLALALLAWPGAAPRGRILAQAAPLIAAYLTTLTPIIAGAYLLFALLALRLGARTAPADRSRARALGRALRRALLAAPDLVAATALLVGYGALAARGALRYDARTAGAALDSFAFWFVLLAAVIPISVLGRSITERDFEDRGSRIEDRGLPFLNPRSSILYSHSDVTTLDIFRLAWLYPLVRLYSLGPWNNGWSFATLLLGGAAALWAAAAALTRRPARRELTLLSYLGLALAGMGLGTGAGVAAGCYGLLAYMILALQPATDPGPRFDKLTNRRDEGDRRPTTDESALPEAAASLPHVFTPSALHWLLSGAIPFTAPFVAAWMLVGASVASGVALLSGAAWLILLLNGVTTTLPNDTAPPDARRPLIVAATASVLLGVGAPLGVVALIQPVIEQLQGGLTPYGDINIWPWVGLATIDATHTPVTTLPSIAVAALMLVLSALVYLIARLRDTWATLAPVSEAGISHEHGRSRPTSSKRAPRASACRGPLARRDRAASGG